GRGVFFGIKEACGNREDMDYLGLETGLESKTFIIQGLGKVGSHASKFLIEGGATMVGVAEIEGSIYDPNGIDLEELMAHRKKTGSILDFGNVQNLEDKMAVLKKPCDILIPDAMQNQITDENAPNIHAKI